MRDVVGHLFEPDLEPFVGQKIRMQGIRVPPDGHRPRTRLLLQDFGGALLFLESITAAGAHVHGSAFLVAPGIALTAWHTIKDWQDAGHFDEPNHCIFAGGMAGDQLRVWEVRSCSSPVVGGDVALLVLAPRFPLGEAVTICHFELSAALPAVASEVTTLGMRLEPADAVLPFGAAPAELPTVSITTIASTGAITDHYIGGIPRIKAPCFAAEACSVGGMSGGPVFDEHGRVVGVVSESIGGDDPDDYISFVSLVWPGAMFEFEGVWPKGLFPAGSRLRENWVAEGWRVGSTASGEPYYIQHGSPEFIGPPAPAQGD